MDESKFISSIAGEVRFDTNGMFSYFQPSELPFDLQIGKDIIRKSRETLISLSNLNGRVSGMEEEEKDIILSTLVLKESVHSSSIEGTRSTIGDMYRSEKDKVDETVRRDVEEINNYREALLSGIAHLQNGGKIDVRLLHSLHRTLMNGVRGGNKSPGEFKTSQNAIGTPGDALETAKMVPAPPAAVERLIDNLLDYIDSDEDPLIKIALIHYQFETIHPYRDGNGRIGRLLIMLLLCKEGILTYPVIYPSEYFDRNRSRYIDLLFEVSSEDRFTEWFSFFLGALKEQADRSFAMISALAAYRKQLYSRCASKTETDLVGLFFVNPYLNSKDVADKCGVSSPTAMKLLSKMESAGILRETTGRKKGRLYVADGVLDILMGR
jgi:Fic family protein